MAFALSGVAKVYPLEVEKSFRGAFPHVAEVNLTALAADTVLDLYAVAAADATNGPWLKTMLDRADVLVNVFSLQAARLGVAATTSYELSGTAAAPILTWAGGATPLVLQVVLIVKTKKDMPIVVSPNQ